MDKVFQQKMKSECKNYNLDFKKVYAALSPHYEILKYIEQKRSKCIAPTKFKNHIQFTLDTFLEVNNYVKEDGYIKLSKRCNYLLKQLEYYQEDNKKINPRMKNYFNEKFGKNLPTKSNILAIAVDNLKEIETNTNSDYLKEIVSNVLNYGENFNDRDIYWKIIKVESLQKTIMTSNRTSLKREIKVTIP